MCILGDRGGRNLHEASRRIMNHVMTNNVATRFNFLGRHGKWGLRASNLFEVIYRKYFFKQFFFQLLASEVDTIHLHLVLSSVFSSVTSTTAMSSLTAYIHLLLGYSSTHLLLKCMKTFDEGYIQLLHFIVLHTYIPHGFCHSRYIIFLIMIFDELYGAGISCE